MIKTLAIINLITFFMGNAIYTPIYVPNNHGIYPMTMKVVDTVVDTKGTDSIEDDGGEIILEDSIGHEWIYEEYPEDYYPGDYVSLIMDDNGTPNYIYDDVIINMRCSGYYD